MFTQYTVVSVYKDPSVFTLPGNVQVNANRNIIAVLKFTNDSDASDIHTYFANGNDLTDTAIDAQARAIIQTLNEQEQALGAITLGEFKVPDADDGKLKALGDAQKALKEASVAAEIKERGDAEELAAYAAYLAAKAALDDKK